ncbi:MAG: tetratricopeptide repeat protein [Bacteroidota bacterium]
MKKTLILFILVVFTGSITLRANIHYIDIKSIPGIEAVDEEIVFLFEHEEYINHRIPTWTFDVSKNKLTRRLSTLYDKLVEMPTQRLEKHLLLGDVAHFLYNLEEERFFPRAVLHYKKSQSLAPDDFRGHWFLGNHYALAGLADSSMVQYTLAEALLPDRKVPHLFWSEYAFAALEANRPSHAIYAMEQEKQVLGKPGYFEKTIGNQIRNLLVVPEPDSTYTDLEIWNAHVDDRLTLISRAFGIGLAVDTTWKTDLAGYENNVSVGALMPQPIITSTGEAIGYTIGIVMHPAVEGERLEDFTAPLLKPYSQVEQVLFTSEYSNLLAYEIKDSTLYQDMGGAHMYLLALSREVPEFPGKKLEAPENVFDNVHNGKMNYVKANQRLTRFDSRIFYVFILDASEVIHNEAFDVFSRFFRNQVIIE